MRLDGKVAIVTGSTRGIGEAIVRRFYHEGARTVITGRDEARGQSVKESLSGDGDGHCVFIKADISKKEDVIRLKEESLKAFGGIDILVNNAGAGVSFPFDELPEEMWDRVMDVNLKGTFYCMKIIGRQMVDNRSGVVINMASTYGHVPSHGGSVYGTTKSGIIMMTRQFALEWAKYNVRVNSISPGFIRTPLTESIYRDESVARARKEAIPLGRIGRPEEIASVALFLSSDESSYITGEDILVDGGLTYSVYHRIPGRMKTKKDLTPN